MLLEASSSAPNDNTSHNFGQKSVPKTDKKGSVETFTPIQRRQISLGGFTGFYVRAFGADIL
jgi:hypothetical protein